MKGRIYIKSLQDTPLYIQNRIDPNASDNSLLYIQASCQGRAPDTPREDCCTWLWSGVFLLERKVMDLKNECICMRISPELKKHLRRESEKMGLTMSGYIEHLLKDKPMVAVAEKREINELRLELQAVANNLNQVAHALNGEYYHFPEDAERFEELAQETKTVLEKIYRSI